MFEEKFTLIDVVAELGQQLGGPDEMDGELVVIVDREFKRNAPFQALFHERREDRMVHLPFLTFRMLQKIDELHLEGHKMPSDARAGLINASNKLYLDVKADLGEKIVDTILAGRVKIGFLIDSGGGQVQLLDYYTLATQYFVANRGMSEAFVTGHACSAAFELVAGSQSINLMDESQLMWHFTANGGRDRRQVVKKLREHDGDFPRQKELEDLYRFLERSPQYDENMRAFYYNKIVDRKNPDGDLRFSSCDFQALEIVDVVHRRVCDMSADFADRYETAHNKSVKDFWVYSEIMDEEASEAGNWATKPFEYRRLQLKNTRIEGMYRHYRRLFLPS